MTIHLPEDLTRFVLHTVKTGLFASEDEAIAEAVRLLRSTEPLPTEADPEPGGLIIGNDLPVWEQVMATMSDVPDEVFEQIPNDDAEQHDHYLYGTPKRPAS